EGGKKGNHWLQIETVGKVSNRDGLGTKIKVVGESGLTQYGYVTTGGSYLSSSDKRVHFGLGSDKRIQLIELHWPSGRVQRLSNVNADQLLIVREQETKNP
ncbi:MAG: ASPIC/UnbV domain-containing protein, partial [Acidobacteria bacterium]|nr:ASPIC/UnbV domain-containing protein [Acidobacteriota bacterium]